MELESFSKLEILCWGFVFSLLVLAFAILFTYQPSRFPQSKAKPKSRGKTKARTSSRGRVNNQPRHAPSDDQLWKEFREFKEFKRNAANR